MFDHAKGTVVRKNRTRIARSGCCNPLARDVLQSARLQTEELQNQKKKKKNHSSCAISPTCTLYLSVHFPRTITEQIANQRAVRLIQSVFFLSCRGRSVGLLILCSTRGSSPGILKKHLREKKPQIKSQISSLLRMSWPRVEEEKRKKSSEAKAEDQRRLEKN